MAKVLSVNLARPRPNPDNPGLSTGIDKHPTGEAIDVRTPGPKHGGLGSGLVGDAIGNRNSHGGDDQAVYAYAREDLDDWQVKLGRELTNGMFGENVTTAGLDVTGALIGERWKIGEDGLLLEVSRPRTPCRTFADWLSLQGWVKTFTAAAIPGAYFRVVQPGTLRTGDRIEVVERPDHGITIEMVFRAMTLEHELLPRILNAEALADDVKQVVTQRLRTG
jgi:MOSC domain-containing protein YiiM